MKTFLCCAFLWILPYGELCEPVRAGDWENRLHYHLNYEIGEPIWHIVLYIDQTHTEWVWRERFPDDPNIDRACGQGVNAYLRTLTLQEYREQRNADELFKMLQLCNAYVRNR